MLYEVITLQTPRANAQTKVCKRAVYTNVPISIDKRVNIFDINCKNILHEKTYKYFSLLIISKL